MQKPFAPSAENNQRAILQALREEVEDADLVLELGSGTGQHVCHFAEALPRVRWQPTDLSERLPGIVQWWRDSGCSNILTPVALNVADAEWPVNQADICYTANTLHIISWPAVQLLFAGCARVLGANGKLCAYGPFIFSGEHISESNVQFDHMLSTRDSTSGIRDLVALDQLAEEHGFAPARIVIMPTNNHFLIWECQDRG